MRKALSGLQSLTGVTLALAGGGALVAIISSLLALHGPLQSLNDLLLGTVALSVTFVMLGVLALRPWISPWVVLIGFPLTAELQLRLSPAAGTSKDLVTAILGLITAYHYHQRPVGRERLHRLASPFAALGVLASLYILNPGGGHSSDWFFGARLLLEGLFLLLVGLLIPEPQRAVRHLVNAVCVIASLEAAFAWIQQAAGQDNLIYQWGYAFGSQVRQTSSGGLRTSGTFADPFQLAALAVVALCVAAFLATRVQAVILIMAATGILAATSVRSALIEAGVIALLYLLRRGWYVPAAAMAATALVTAVFIGLTVTSAQYTGGPEKPLLLGLNGRTTAWSQAVTGPKSLLVGHGVGVVGSGSDRAVDGLTTRIPRYDPNQESAPLYAGNSGFLDSTYAQIQSDVGFAGLAALLIWVIGAFARLRRPLSSPESFSQNAARWAAIALLVTSAIDWVGRTSLASYTTGFIFFFVFGVLLAAAVAPESDSAIQRRPTAHGLLKAPRRDANWSVSQWKSAKLERTPTAAAVLGRSDELASAAVVSGVSLARVGVIAALLSRLFSRMVGILFIAVLAHQSSDTTIAVFGYLLGTATLVATFTDLGVAGIAGRDVAAGKLPADGALAAAVPAQIGSIVAACGLTLFLAWAGGPSALTVGPVAVTLVFVAVNGMVNLWSEVLRGQGRVTLEASIQVATATLFVAGGLLVVLNGGGPTDLLMVVAGKELVGLSLCWIALRPRRRSDIIRPRDLIGQSAYLAVAGTAIVLLWREGTILVGAFASLEALTVYVIASRFLDAGVTLAQTVGFGLLPGAANAVKDPAEFRFIAGRYLKLASVAGLVIGLCGVVLASPVTLTVFGNRWHDAIPAVRVIAVAILPILVSYVAWFLLLASDEQRWLAVSSIASLLLSLGASIIWLQYDGGPLAAAGGTAIGAFVLASLLILRLDRIAVFRPR